ncbi:uncharacterized protein EV422DRAFT_119845 [Fimicolochytrium jonesii]|uniref:uncharacterized protein n=1 Tax=Fimicolochytrium jonesii TaxID=1396493 RepID=UPI0022FF0B9E|nr:uncharacterized protein EV422DRAFT_119845 [Fimicolochytrium jonesii]KAI8819161.1 hypothetical protein EV422DRAFT_119845 [Fimicolochytrium jonesii]
MRSPTPTLLFVLLAALLLSTPAAPAPISPSPSPTFPGTAFLQTLLHSPPLKNKFATRLPLPPASTLARRHLPTLHTATLSQNLSTLLSPHTAFPFPTFANTRCDLVKDTRPVIPFTEQSGLQAYFTALFDAIPPATRNVITLSRFDLFHAHLFASPSANAVGLVFHSKEYPTYSAQAFPYNLGFCQLNSTVAYNDAQMRRRNIVWLLDGEARISLWWIDMAARSGRADVDAVLNEAPFYTLYEDDLGHVVADLDYLRGTGLGMSLY